RLEEEGFGAGPNRFDGVRDRALGRHHDAVRRDALLAGAFEDLHAVEVVHAQVEQDQIERLLFEPGQRFVAAAGPDALASDAAQIVDQQPTMGVVIVDDEDPPTTQRTFVCYGHAFTIRLPIRGVNGLTLPSMLLSRPAPMGRFPRSRTRRRQLRRRPLCALVCRPPTWWRCSRLRWCRSTSYSRRPNRSAIRSAPTCRGSPRGNRSDVHTRRTHTPANSRAQPTMGRRGGISWQPRSEVG